MSFVTLGNEFSMIVVVVVSGCSIAFLPFVLAPSLVGIGTPRADGLQPDDWYWQDRSVTWSIDRLACQPLVGSVVAMLGAIPDLFAWPMRLLLLCVGVALGALAFNLLHRRIASRNEETRRRVAVRAAKYRAQFDPNLPPYRRALMAALRRHERVQGR